jgi:hypothetical protein
MAIAPIANIALSSQRQSGAASATCTAWKTLVGVIGGEGLWAGGEGCDDRDVDVVTDLALVVSVVAVGSVVVVGGLVTCVVDPPVLEEDPPEWVVVPPPEP